MPDCEDSPAFEYAGKLVGPMLKVEWAKRHIQQFQLAVQAFMTTKPYQIVGERDPKTGENVVRVRVHKILPVELSAIAGDAVHNLRSALDQTICELVKANRKQVRIRHGFPIAGGRKAFEKDAAGKINAISPKAQRLVHRLKPYQGGNTALWMLNQLDALDKHQGIIPVAVAHLHTAVRPRIPNFLFVGKDGKGLAIGGRPGPDWKPLINIGFGTPKGFKPTYALTDNAEIYRAAPGPVGQDMAFAIRISFGKTGATLGEPVVETLKHIADRTERIIGIFERRTL